MKLTTMNSIRPRWMVVIAAAVTLCLCACAPRATADDVPMSSPVAISDEPAPVKIERAFPNLKFDRPIFLTAPPDGSNRIAVMAQRGQVLVFPNNQDATESTVMLEIRDRVRYKDSENEEGLLGLAFHPKFKENGELFVYYTPKEMPRVSVISRFRVSKQSGVADPLSEEEILRIEQPFWNHNGGTIVFGPDGMLYVGMGDGGAANDPNGNGQNMETLLGKVLRIDVDRRDDGKAYAIPADNPFVDMPGARPEIYALGIRNIWRMAFDPKTDKLWAGDVGQDTWEEVDLIERGGNYGWNLREGFHKFTEYKGPHQPGPAPEKIVGKLVDPIFEYHHDIGKSITGGNVYRGKDAPELVGKYLFADYVSGKVYALTYDESTGKTTAVHPIEGNTMPVFSFGEDAHGETYFMTTQGTLWKFNSGK